MASSIGDDQTSELSPTTTTGTTATEVMFRAYSAAPKLHRSRRACPDPALAAGMPLPAHLRQAFPKDLIGRQIDDFDPFYSNKKTSVVVGHHWTIHRFDGEKSLFLMSPSSLVRSASIATVTHAGIDLFMFLVILANVVCFTSSATYYYRNLQEFFLLIYFIELVVKVIAYGFLVKRFTYLRDPWNWLDFLVTLIGFLMFPVYRRADLAPFRFLRLVNFFTTSRLTFATSCSLLFKMRDVICFAAFSLFFYSVYFMVFYAGAFWTRCLRGTSDYSVYREEYLHSTANWLIGGDGQPILCGNYSALYCPMNYTCFSVHGRNPKYSLSNFDTFFSSALSILRLMTRDSWEDLLTLVERTRPSAWNIPNFLVVIVLGSFILNNFIMARMAIAHGQLMSILQGNAIEREDKTSLSRDGDGAEGACSLTENERHGEGGYVVSSNVAVHYNKGDSHKKEPQVIIVTDTGDCTTTEADMDANPLTACCSSWCQFLCSWKCCSRLQSCLSAIVSNRYFDWFIYAIIVTNTFAMSLPARYELYMYKDFCFLNMLAMLIFTVEAILKILAMSPNRYFRDSWCVFEFVVIFIAMLDMLAAELVGASILLLRSFLIFRIVRATRFYARFTQLLKLTFLNAYVLTVFTLAFGLLGYVLFGLKQLWHWDPIDENPRLSFDKGWHSLMIVLRVLCGRWSEAYRDCTSMSASPCLLYFFAIVVLGNLLVINVFISMIMTSLPGNHLCSDDDDDDDDYLDFSKIGGSFRRLFTCRQEQSAEQHPAARSEEELFEVSLEGEATMAARHPEFNITVGDGGAQPKPCCPTAFYFCFGSPITPSPMPQGVNWSAKWQNVRNGALAITGHRFFHAAASGFIFVACIAQTLEDQDQGWARIMAVRVVNIVVCIVFSLELALKLLGVGFKKHFSDGWSCFDFTITTLHILGYLVTGFRMHISLELLKALRVLKLFTYHERLRVLVEAVLFSFGRVVTAAFAAFFVWLIFAIMGVHIFRYHKLESSDVDFSDVPNALIALLQLATMRGDLDILFNMMDSNRLFQDTPSREASTQLYVYMMLFMLFGVLCCLACVFRAFITKANSQSKLCGGYLETLMTPDQAFSYVESKRAFFKKPLDTVPEPEVACLLPLYRMVTSRTFNMVVFLVLGFNAAAMALHDPLNDRGSRMHIALEFVQLFFNSFFVIEVVLKLIAFRRHFFDSAWNVYDLVVISHLPISLAVQMASTTLFMSPTLLQLLYQLRLLILLRLVRRIKCVRRVCHDIWVSGAAYKNVAFLLTVVVFFYARLGMGWFGDNDRPYKAGIDHLHNFNSFGAAMSTMTEMAFGGIWDRIHRGLAPSRFSTTNYCPSSFQTTLFVLSHLATCFLVIIHFAAVLLLEHYERLWKKLQLRITDQDLEDFAHFWRIFDPYGTGSMSSENFVTFLAALPPTYNLEVPVTEDKIASLGIKATLQEQRYTFDDVLVALLRSLDTDGEVFKQPKDSRAA